MISPDAAQRSNFVDALVSVSSKVSAAASKQENALLKCHARQVLRWPRWEGPRRVLEIRALTLFEHALVNQPCGPSGNLFPADPRTRTYLLERSRLLASVQKSIRTRRVEPTVPACVYFRGDVFIAEIDVSTVSSTGCSRNRSDEISIFGV